MHAITLHAFARAARTALVCTLVVAVAAGPAAAGTVRYYPTGSTPDARVVADILGGAAVRKPPRLKMRGGAPLDEPAAQPRSAALPNDGGRNLAGDPLVHEAALLASAQTAVQTWQARPGAQPVQEAPTALALAIEFDNNSARLQDASLRSLDAVADGLRLAGPAAHVVIEGHTSASGSWQHNLRLSQARAESVKRYLVQRHHIAAASLRTVGFGPATPLNPNDPNAAENRRVQFRAA